MDKQRHVIDINALSKTYGRLKALQDVSLQIAVGEVVALLGKNGAGKSSLLRCLLGLTKPDNGQIRLLGQPAGSAIARAQLGVMLQEQHPPTTLTVWELCQLFASFYPAPLSVTDLLDRLALLPLCRQRYGQLSGGQQRRVQLALALIGDPSVLLLDEPTTFMDSESIRLCWDLLEQLRQQGKTILLITHQLNALDNIAGKIVLIDNGRLLQSVSIRQFRQQFNAVQVNCKTALSAEQLKALSGVQAVWSFGPTMRIHCCDSDGLLRQLYQLDGTICDIDIRQPSLDSLLETVLHQSTTGGRYEIS
ncbi:MAG: ABC transporter ATP-binding protein [Alishewanella aestuarii]